MYEKDLKGKIKKFKKKARDEREIPNIIQLKT